MYDYLIVGCGLFGATVAQQFKESGKSVLLIDQRNHIGGNCFTENIDGINVHKYGPHIFHTNSKKIWDYVNRFIEFNNFVYRPKVSYKDKIFSFPINLFTLYQLWNVKNPAEALYKLNNVRIKHDSPDNLEEWILSNVGEEIYEIFIKGYTTKQWGRKPNKLPASIIKRLPIRLNFDDNYFTDRYQGIPVGGYTQMILNMVYGCEIILGANYFEKRDYWDSLAKKIVYTGKIDEFYNYKFGKLEYRSLLFETEVKNTEDYQGVAVINYTEEKVPYTRIIEHKHFENTKSENTVLTKEFPIEYNKSTEPYYPINDTKNQAIYSLYKKLSQQENKYIFGGRLAEYKYYDMHQVIASALGIKI